MSANRWLPYLLLLIFWGAALRYLDRFPIVSQDEPWILSPGYQLFWRGVYGSNLFAGLYGMDKHYLEFLPLMSMVQGGVARFIGVGVWQLRYAPVALGLLTLALTFALARRLADASVGVLAMSLLIFWQWRPTGGPVLGSGLPLLDVARIGRYDILVAPLALSALWAYVHARGTGPMRYASFSGLLAGLAGATHVYGLLWGGLIFGMFIFDALSKPRSSASRHALAFVMSLGAIWLALAIWPILYWDDFVNQQRLNGQYFDVFNPTFYLNNLAREPQRYGVGWYESLAWSRAGLWVLVLGVPAALLWLGKRALFQTDWRARLLIGPAVLIPFVSAVLIQHKLFNYLISVAPVWALMLAWGALRWFRAAGWVGRLAGLALLALLVGQGMWAMLQLHQRARQLPSPQNFLAELRRVVPPNQRILGTHDYWLALPDRDYRSYAIPIYLAEATLNPAPVSFGEALEQLAPEIVLLDARMLSVLNDVSTPAKRARSQEFWAYMHTHHAHVIAQILNYQNAWVWVYQLADE